MKIINAILQLKQTFAEQGGEVLQINLDKKAHKALQRECQVLPSPIEGLCPKCYMIANNKILGIEIIQSEDGEVFGVQLKKPIDKMVMYLSRERL